MFALYVRVKSYGDSDVFVNSKEDMYVYFTVDCNKNETL